MSTEKLPAERETRDLPDQIWADLYYSINLKPEIKSILEGGKIMGGEGRTIPDEKKKFLENLSDPDYNPVFVFPPTSAEQRSLLKAVIKDNLAAARRVAEDEKNKLIKKIWVEKFLAKIWSAKLFLSQQNGNDEAAARYSRKTNFGFSEELVELALAREQAMLVGKKISDEPARVENLRELGKVRWPLEKVKEIISFYLKFTGFDKMGYEAVWGRKEGTVAVRYRSEESGDWRVIIPDIGEKRYRDPAGLLRLLDHEIGRHVKSDCSGRHFLAAMSGEFAMPEYSTIEEGMAKLREEEVMKKVFGIHDSAKALPWYVIAIKLKTEGDGMNFRQLFDAIYLRRYAAFMADGCTEGEAAKKAKDKTWETVFRTTRIFTKPDRKNRLACFDQIKYLLGEHIIEKWLKEHGDLSFLDIGKISLGVAEGADSLEKLGIDPAKDPYPFRSLAIHLWDQQISVEKIEEDLRAELIDQLYDGIRTVVTFRSRSESDAELLKGDAEYMWDYLLSFKKKELKTDNSNLTDKEAEKLAKKEMESILRAKIEGDETRIAEATSIIKERGDYKGVKEGDWREEAIKHLLRQDIGRLETMLLVADEQIKEISSESKTRVKQTLSN